MKFIRFTNKPYEDVERGTSVHLVPKDIINGYASNKLAEKENYDDDDEYKVIDDYIDHLFGHIKEWKKDDDGDFIIVLNGLCGFEEDDVNGIAEYENGDGEGLQKWLFEGEEITNCYTPVGIVFVPKKLLGIKE